MMNNNEAGQPAAIAGKMMFFGGTGYCTAIHAFCDIWQLYQNDEVLR